MISSSNLPERQRAFEKANFSRMASSKSSSEFNRISPLWSFDCPLRKKEKASSKSWKVLSLFWKSHLIIFPEVILATCIESVPNVLISYDPSNSTSRNLSYRNIERCKERSVYRKPFMVKCLIVRNQETVGKENGSSTGIRHRSKQACFERIFSRKGKMVTIIC